MHSDRDVSEGAPAVDGQMPEVPFQDSLRYKEIDFIKGLQALIGETNGISLVSSYVYRAARDFVPFDSMGILICCEKESEIHLFVADKSRAGIDLMKSTLVDRLPAAIKGASEPRVMVMGESSCPSLDSPGCEALVLPLSVSGKELGFAGIFRQNSFTAEEERRFGRLCADLALTLEKVQLFDRVTELATKDGLTGIFNHLHIVTKLEWEIARSTRYGSHLSIILFDIDNFKDINDRYGHLAGNQVLTKMAQLLKNSVRSIDSVGRYGGEEFLAVLPETDAEAALTMAERLRNRIRAEDFLYEDQVIKLTVSGGVAGYRAPEDANALIKAADTSLFAAKKQGKNVVIYDKH